MKKIVMTGGGTAGHVTPNIALMPTLIEAGFEIYYIGSYEGMEKGLIEKLGVPYYGVSTGKLRRYMDVRNLTDPFRVMKGIGEAKKILKEIGPDVVFSKGGFVSVPVVKAAASLKIPVIVHESDYTPGLANKLCFPSARKVCCDFPETMDMLPEGKGVLTGSPVRKELLDGDPAKGREMCGFPDDKPVLMVIGGSQGASAVNQSIRDALPKLLQQFYVVHLCGKDKMDNLLLTKEGYKQFEYVTDGLADIFAMADVVVSRAGANAIFELLTLRKPNILIPLPGGRGDQILNAESFQQQGFSVMIDQDDLSTSYLFNKINDLYANRAEYIKTMSASEQNDAIGMITDLLVKTASGEE